MKHFIWGGGEGTNRLTNEGKRYEIATIEVEKVNVSIILSLIVTILQDVLKMKTFFLKP